MTKNHKVGYYWSVWSPFISGIYACESDQIKSLFSLNIPNFSDYSYVNILTGLLLNKLIVFLKDTFIISYLIFWGVPPTHQVTSKIYR